MKEDQIRVAFEEWYSGGQMECPSIEHKNESYKLIATYNAWQAFRAGYQFRDATKEIEES